MGSLKLLPLVTILGAAARLARRSRPPTVWDGPRRAEEIRAWDISISPTGKELPPGRGTAKEGAQLFRAEGVRRMPRGNRDRSPGADVDQRWTARRTGQAPPAGMEGMHMVPDTGIMALRSPFAVTIWDYINRGMPLGKEGTLKPDEVYALTAFLLYKNDVIKEDEVMDAQSSAEGEHAESQWIRQPSGVEAWRAEACGLPIGRCGLQKVLSRT